MDISEDELSDHLSGIVADPQCAAQLVFAGIRAERMLAAQQADGMNKVERAARDLIGIPEGL